ncbi:hypothetical protein [Mycolicibacter kumamotonensis]|uniref:Uncharacterized protein n=1 Tax=Mycolicibacter kumamotonensis TaxID=354243 RepID=A0A1B8SL03_9MYCO|nr:hypothetical protein [Mycolicibacter kumamotonensis]OBY33415.1 hypothetical protein ACT18_00165 [Mycolicibacter kumamotonensis]
MFPKYKLSLANRLQAVVAALATLGSIGTTALHTASGFLPTDWAALLASGLAVVAAVCGFLEKIEHVLEHDEDKGK